MEVTEVTFGGAGVRKAPLFPAFEVSFLALLRWLDIRESYQ